MARIKDSKHWRPNEQIDIVRIRSGFRPDRPWEPLSPVVSLPVPLSLQVKRGAGKSKVSEEGFCRMCLRPADVRPLTRHHLIKQQWFRDHKDERYRTLRNCDACIVPLCRLCHNEVESDPYARRLLRRVLTQAEIAFCIAVRNRKWFENRYPSGRAVS